jgi:hypothetical protein
MESGDIKNEKHGEVTQSGNQRKCEIKQKEESEEKASPKLDVKRCHAMPCETCQPVSV